MRDFGTETSSITNHPPGTGRRSLSASGCGYQSLFSQPLHITHRWHTEQALVSLVEVSSVVVPRREAALAASRSSPNIRRRSSCSRNYAAALGTAMSLITVTVLK